MHSVRTAPWQSPPAIQWLAGAVDALRADSAVAKCGGKLNFYRESDALRADSAVAKSS